MNQRLSIGPPADYSTGWDLSNEGYQNLVMGAIALHKPLVIFFQLVMGYCVPGFPVFQYLYSATGLGIPGSSPTLAPEGFSFPILPL